MVRVALSEPSSSRFPGDILIQKSREAVGRGHRNTEGSHCQVGDDVTSAMATPRPPYQCGCGHVLRVSGGGRHRVYFELDDALCDHPLMNRACPACGLRLPGKGTP
jgi:hypothetical protein